MLFLLKICLNMDNTHTNLDINMDNINFVNFNKKYVLIWIILTLI